MSSIIKINIADKIANLAAPAVIVRGNSGYMVEFTFDSEWDELQNRIAVFNYRRYGASLCQKVEFTGSRCSIPTMYWDTSMVDIGVMVEGVISSTTVRIYCDQSALDGDANEVDIGTDGSLTAKNGASAYELAVSNGYTGTVQEWLESLKGEDGESGHTPVKGVDYWTTNDKEEIISAVLGSLPNGDEVSY